jgi:hypothetical protein
MYSNLHGKNTILQPAVAFVFVTFLGYIRFSKKTIMKTLFFTPVVSLFCLLGFNTHFTPNNAVNKSASVVYTEGVADYAGIYKPATETEIGNISIEVKEGKVFATAMGQTGELSPTSTADVYEEPNYRATFTFIRTPEKKVNKLTLTIPAMQLNLEYFKQE